MARLVRQEKQAGVYEHLLTKHQESVSRHIGGIDVTPWLIILEQLEAGEPVVVSGWQLRTVLRDVEFWRRYEVWPDDSVRIVDDLVRFEVE